MGPAVHHARDARGQRAVEAVDLAHRVGPQHVAGGVGAVEGGRVVDAEGQQQAARAVGVVELEVGVLEQLLDARERTSVGALWHPGLEREPFVEHQRLVPECRVEVRQCLVGQLGV
jgi:hypothetical protein